MEVSTVAKTMLNPLVDSRDPVRIVPLHLPENKAVVAKGAARRPKPKLVYRGGPLLTAPAVFTVFWGAQWAKQPLLQTAKAVNGFFDYLLTSPLIDQLGEYSVPAYKIGHGARSGTTTLTSSPSAALSDGAIQHMLRQEISSNKAFPSPGPNTLYFVYLPPGVVVTQGGGQSCQGFCGYHSAINAQTFYAVMPYPSCVGCIGQLPSPLAALTTTSSHELCEAITDPIPGEGWYDERYGEIGDICAWQTKELGGYTVQMEWSNAKGGCV
jgi:hypothetical protein